MNEIINKLKIVEVKPSLIKNWIQKENLSELPTIKCRNLFKKKYRNVELESDNLIPDDSYLILACLKLNLFHKDLKSLFDSDINITENKFGDFKSIHDFLEDIVKETKEINPDNYQNILKNYLEVICLAINYDIQLMLNWNLVLDLFE